MPTAEMLRKGCRSLRHAKLSHCFCSNSKGRLTAIKNGGVGAHSWPREPQEQGWHMPGAKMRCLAQLRPSQRAPGGQTHPCSGTHYRRLQQGGQASEASTQEGAPTSPAPCLQAVFMWHAGTMLQPAREAGSTGAAQAAPQDQGSSYLNAGKSLDASRAGAAEHNLLHLPAKETDLQTDLHTHMKFPASRKKGKLF